MVDLVRDRLVARLIRAVTWTSTCVTGLNLADLQCDGTQNCPQNPDGQSQTAATFKGKFLDAAEVPYVVINQQGTFDFTHFGIELMSAVTVVCNGKMFAAVIGDTNGESQMGEVSNFRILADAAGLDRTRQGLLPARRRQRQLGSRRRGALHGPYRTYTARANSRIAGRRRCHRLAQPCADRGARV